MMKKVYEMYKNKSFISKPFTNFNKKDAMCFYSKSAIVNYLSSRDHKNMFVVSLAFFLLVYCLMQLGNNFFSSECTSFLLHIT